MKKIFIFIITVLIVIESSGQDFKVKKGIVLIDDVPTLKMIGDCGIFKRLNYSILTMSDDTLLKMRDDSFSFSDPRNESLLWHEIWFKNINKTIKIKKDATYVSDKQVIKFIYSFQPQLIVNGILDTAAVSKFIKEHDITSSIISDTTSLLAFERAQEQAIHRPNPVRNPKMPVILARPMDSDKYSLPGFGPYSVFEIFQDKMFLGIIVQVNKQSGMEVKTAYYFMKKINTPVYYLGFAQYFGMIGYVEDLNMGFMTNMHTREAVCYSAPVQSPDKLLDYTKHLIDLGCL